MIDPVTGLTLVPQSVAVRRTDNELFLKSNVGMGAWVETSAVWLRKWATETPDAVFLAERSGVDWREVTYAETLQIVRNIASALSARGLDQKSPIAIISGNSVDHALLSFAAQYAGVPTVPLAEQYSLIPEAHGRLIYALQKVKPAMVFADDAKRYAAALAHEALAKIEVVSTRTVGSPRPVTSFSELLKGDDTVNLEEIHSQVGPDTIAKILFTSGSSSDPKGVVTTHRMMCANQAQMAAVLPFLKERPPRILDWLPWNHVFGGSHNVNMMLAHGGALYIDDGKPTKTQFEKTIRNVTDKPGTLAFNVPIGFSMLVSAMETNFALRDAYFRELDMILYAGASLPQDIWRRLEEMALEIRGRLPLMISSWGMTETAPATLLLHEHIGRSGVVGVPLPLTEIKLLPDEEMRCELRVNGPNVMRKYWDDPVNTSAAFDEDGFLITGDAVRFVDINDPDRGLIFDGRISEDFKLLTGTWVRAAALRADALMCLAPLAADVVITGQDRNEIGVLVFPDMDALKDAEFATEQKDGVLICPLLHANITQRLNERAGRISGSSTRIARALVLSEQPSVADGEITAKGNLNFRKVLTRRAAQLARLYNDNDPAVVRI